MSGHRQYKITDYRFGNMILGLREKVGLTQMEVAEALDVSRRTIQHWEAGTTFPSGENLKSLIAHYLQYGAFTPGHEYDEAQAVWIQMDESSSRRKSPFDKVWFDGLLRQWNAQVKPDSQPVQLQDSPAAAVSKIDWGDAPDVGEVYGRTPELSQLSQWILEKQCRLVTILGMGGIGKTTLAVKLAQEVAGEFEYVIWRSLRNAPLLQDLLLECFQILSPVQPVKPSIQFLLELLQQHKCLLIFDNAETLHRAGNLTGIYQKGLEEYQHLFQSIARTRHQSCLILTTREMPVEIQPFEGDPSAVRVLKVTGLSSKDCQAILSDKELFGPYDAWNVFVHYYTGNPMALKIASTSVRDLFGGDLAAFLKEAPVTLHTLNQLLENQFTHLSPLERDIMFWLAIERDPVELAMLRQDIAPEIPNREILAGLFSLLQRSLIERSSQGAVFSLLPIVLEFVTDRLVNMVVEQIGNRNLDAITKYALVKSRSVDYIRQSQVRMILQPVTYLLTRHFGSQTALADFLRQLVADVRKRPYDAQIYAGGNLVNLLAYLNGHIRGEDFSSLQLRQVYLQGIATQDARFSDVEFIDSRFTEPLETISAMALSPRGNYLAANTYNGHIRCWNVADGKPVWSATNAKRNTWSMTFNLDETLLACSHLNGRVSAWDVATSRQRHTFVGHEAWVFSVAFHPTSQFLASGGTDARLCVWDLEQEKLHCVLVIEGHSARIWSVTFNPTGELLISGRDEGAISVWDWRKGELLHLLHHSTSGSASVAFHPNGKWMASCNEQDPYIKLWNIHTGDLVFDLASHSKGPNTIAFNPDGSYLICGGNDGSTEMWQINNEEHPQYVKMFMSHSHYISTISFSQNDLLATLSQGDAIKLWNVKSGKLLRVIEGYSRLIGANAFSPDGKQLLQGDGNGKIRVWDMLNHRYIKNIQGHTGPIWDIKFSPDGKTFATAGDDRSLRIWDATSFHCLKNFPRQTAQIWSLVFNHDGSLLASGGSPQALKVWDPGLHAGKEEVRPFQVSEDVWALAFDPSGELLVSGHANGCVIIWDVRTGQKKTTLRHGTLPVGAIEFSSDGRTLITSSNQELLKYWDLETATCRQTVSISAERNRIRAVVISKNRKFVATGSGGPELYLWHLEPTRDKIEPILIEGHTSRVWAIALSPDDRYLASSDEEGTTLLADVVTGEVVQKIFLDRPYERMNVRGVIGLNPAEHTALKALGATETD